jgi:hypothetical protein
MKAAEHLPLLVQKKETLTRIVPLQENSKSTTVKTVVDKE